MIGYFINYFINKQLIVFTAILLGFFWLVSVFLSKEILSSKIMRSSGKKTSVDCSCLCRVQASRLVFKTPISASTLWGITSFVLQGCNFVL